MSKRYWDSFYQDLAQPSANAPYEPWLEALLQPQLGQGRSSYVLDIGCGLGLDSAYLRGKGFSVLSVDVSIQALQKARAAGNVTSACVSRAETLASGLPAHCFDLVVASLSLHYMPHETLCETLFHLLKALCNSAQLIARFNHHSDLNFGAEHADEQGYFKRIEQGEETLKVFYTRETLENLCKKVLAALQVAYSQSSWRYELQSSESHLYGRPKRMITMLWYREPAE